MPVPEHPSRPVGHDQLAGTLDRPVLRFDLAAELQRLLQDDAGQRGASSITLVKHPDLRLVLIALRHGQTMSEHRANARITVHVLQGWIRFRLPERIEDLRPGQILVLDTGLVHDVHALEDSAFLLTLAWPASAS